MIHDGELDQDEFLDKLPKPEIQTVSCLSYEKNEPNEAFWKDYFSISEIEEIIIKKIKEEQENSTPINMFAKKEEFDDSLSLSIAHNYSTNDSADIIPIIKTDATDQKSSISNLQYFDQTSNQTFAQSQIQINPEISQNFGNSNSNIFNPPNQMPIAMPIMNNYNPLTGQIFPVIYTSNVPVMNQNNQIISGFNNLQTFVQHPPPTHQVVLLGGVNNPVDNYAYTVVNPSDLQQFYQTKPNNSFK